MFRTPEGRDLRDEWKTEEEAIPPKPKLKTEKSSGRRYSG
jgi:hypothetical protein